MHSIKKLDNGFEYIQIQNSVSSAKIALQGAHIYEYKRERRKDILWLSESSAFEYGSAIRGGIPVCWPRFGVLDKSMPAHGFSRTALFELKEVKELSASETKVALSLKDTRESRAIWNYKFELELIFCISNVLKVEMKTTNMSDEPFLITEALHSYFSVSHIKDVSIVGLQKKNYIDTLKNKILLQEGHIKIDQETDRVYEGEAKKIELKDKNRTIYIQAEGSASTIVWNPWIEKGSNMTGMLVEAYKEFVCIENGNAFDEAVIVEPTETHTMSIVLR